MHPDILFSFANTLALLSWMLLLFLPRWRRVAQTSAQTLVPLLLACAYLGLLMAGWSRSQGGFGSLAEVAALFGEKNLLLAGWLHYLAFDLLAGAWILRVAEREAIRPVHPALVLTFLFGPAGYLLFQFQRAAKRLRLWHAGASGSRRAFWPWMQTWEPSLLAGGLGMAALLLPTLVAHGMDDRLLEGVPVWLKPLKFEASLAIFFLTLSAFFPMAGPHFRQTRRGRLIIWGGLLAGVLEVLYIAFQAGRGEASHYNRSTPLYGALYAAMGVGALLLVSCAQGLASGIRSHQRSLNPAPLEPFVLSVVLGLSLSCFLGGLAGVVLSAQPGHFGHAVSGGATLPGLGWSRVVGDLRAAHFLGMHALQILPAAGWVASRVLEKSAARRWILLLGVLYAAWVLFAFVQALLGRPFVGL